MARIAVVTDSTADLPQDLVRRHGIHVVPQIVAFGDRIYHDGVDLSADEFLRLLAESPDRPTTSQPSPEVFAALYRRLAETHDAVVSIHISAKLSDTVLSATIAARSVADEIPVTVIDSDSASMGCGLLAITAATMAARNAPISAIRDRVADEAAHMDIVFMVESLEALRRGGRIGRASAMLGTVLDLKPILRLTAGDISPLERTRTRRRAIHDMISYVKRQDGIRRICAVYTGRPDEARNLLREFDLLVPRDGMFVTTLGPTMASHAGPGVIGFVFERETAQHG